MLKSMPLDANMNKKECLLLTMVQHINNVPTETTGAMAPTTATAMAAINNLDQVHANQIQLLVRLAIIVRRRITFNLIATKANEITPLWSRFKKWKNKKGAGTLKPSSHQKTRPQLL